MLLFFLWLCIMYLTWDYPEICSQILGMIQQWVIGDIFMYPVEVIQLDKIFRLAFQKQELIGVKVN